MVQDMGHKLQVYLDNNYEQTFVIDRPVIVNRFIQALTQVNRGHCVNGMLLDCLSYSLDFSVRQCFSVFMTMKMFLKQTENNVRYRLVEIAQSDYFKAELVPAWISDLN